MRALYISVVHTVMHLLNRWLPVCTSTVILILICRSIKTVTVTSVDLVPSSEALVDPMIDPMALVPCVVEATSQAHQGSDEEDHADDTNKHPFCLFQAALQIHAKDMHMFKKTSLH